MYKIKLFVKSITLIVLAVYAIDIFGGTPSPNQTFLGGLPPSNFGCNLETKDIKGYVFTSTYEDQKWFYRIKVNDEVVSLNKKTKDIYFPNTPKASSTMHFSASGIAATLKVTFTTNTTEGSDAYTPGYIGTLSVQFNDKHQTVNVAGICEN